AELRRVYDGAEGLPARVDHGDGGPGLVHEVEPRRGRGGAVGAQARGRGGAGRERGQGEGPGRAAIVVHVDSSPGQGIGASRFRRKKTPSRPLVTTIVPLLKNG